MEIIDLLWLIMANYEREKQTLRVYYEGIMNMSQCDSTSRAGAAESRLTAAICFRHHTMCLVQERSCVTQVCKVHSYGLLTRSSCKEHTFDSHWFSSQCFIGAICRRHQVRLFSQIFSFVPTDDRNPIDCVALSNFYQNFIKGPREAELYIQ